MAAIPQSPDPTLEAADRAMEVEAAKELPRPYLGISGLGRDCRRQIWSDFRWLTPPAFAAATLKRFEDGHHGEDVMAARLRLVDGLSLWTVDAEAGGQFACEDLGGHLRGHMDGVLLGLLQAPKTPHVWEHKQVDEQGLAKLERAKVEYGEKNALRMWNAVYFAQGQLYMHYLDIERHYLTCSTAGGRRTIGVRTERDTAEALRLIEKARAIVFADWPPERISSDPAFYQCRWCQHAGTCHEGTLPQRNCRTCLHVTPRQDGSWHCSYWNAALSIDEQRTGCTAHLYIPDLVAGVQVDAGDDWVEYEMRDGARWRDGP